ncbi:phage adaptor protein [Bradyrhizobium sp. HKCCYLR20261]|uniref:phage adaptor protein n=1 Tax=Bradyrhizobium sp. HKCCYLR20261 TaxID=3420760 RepID=UPI003EB81D50
MPLISNYASLQTAVTEYLARDQDTTLLQRIPSFIQLAEAKFNRQLFVRQMEQRAIAVVDLGSSEPEFIALPSDFQSMRRIRLVSARGQPALEFKSGVQLDEYRFRISDVAGQPRYFSIFGDQIELAPRPDAAYTIEMVYRRTIPPLASNDTNWLLASAPDLYLYGALLESAPYLKEDGRIQTWGLGFTNALADLNTLGLTSTFNAGPMTMRLSGQVV